jgi:serine/threonine protein kinase/tetratricopeptide (TPR) repeat protein
MIARSPLEKAPLIPSKVSQYTLIEKLGEGGMGVVYKAQDTKLDRLVALKFLPPHLSASEQDKARFIQEAKAASALNHPNVCTIFDINEENGQQFIAMEFVDGCTLKHKLPVQKPGDALTYALQIGDALQEAHSKGIVHRDIKCENIMVNTKNQIKVMDFGLAKLRGSLKNTKTSSTVGTLAYMAPEQIRGGQVDMRSDIFSFGVVLFEMLTAHLPFRGDHEAAMMYSILNEEPESVQKTQQDCSPEIDRIIHRALEKDPEDRYQSVADMVSELRREQKKTARVIRPSVAGLSGPTAIANVLPASQPVMRSKKRAVLWSALGVALTAVALVVYFFTGRHQSIDSLAVLPFENVGADPGTEYLSDGITESLINTLSQLSHLSVMSRSSVFHYKGKVVDPQKAGNELGVKAVLVGRVTQRGDNLQISTELVDVSNNSHIWGEQYNKKISDILTVQQDISKVISQQLRVKLADEDEKKLTKHSTENTEAYQLYLKGRFYWNKRKTDDLQKAVDYFNHAIDKDPGYALAYAGLASTYAVLPEYSGMPASNFLPKAEMAAKKALALDATLAEPHAALGGFASYQWDWAGAERECQQAIALDPNNPTAHHWYSNCLVVQGKFEEALSESKRAQELDPLSIVITVNVADVLQYMQRNDQAIEQLHKALELDSNFPGARKELGDVYAQQGKWDEAIVELQKVRQIVGSNNPFAIGDLGSIYARAGKKSEAINILNHLLELSKQGYSLSVEIASVYAGLGYTEEAFEWLEKGYIEQNYSLAYLKIGYEWDTIRSDSRYTAMLRKIGLDK